MSSGCNWLIRGCDGVFEEICKFLRDRDGCSGQMLFCETWVSVKVCDPTGFDYFSKVGYFWQIWRISAAVHLDLVKSVLESSFANVWKNFGNFCKFLWISRKFRRLLGINSLNQQTSNDSPFDVSMHHWHSLSLTVHINFNQHSMHISRAHTFNKWNKKQPQSIYFNQLEANKRDKLWHLSVHNPFLFSFSQTLCSTE